MNQVTWESATRKEKFTISLVQDSSFSSVSCALKLALGPYYISQDDFMVGDVRKYLLLDPVSLEVLGDDRELDVISNRPEAQSAAERWDSAITESDRMYSKMMHNICWCEIFIND